MRKEIVYNMWVIDWVNAFEYKGTVVFFAVVADLFFCVGGERFQLGFDVAYIVSGVGGFAVDSQSVV